MRRIQAAAWAVCAALLCIVGCESKSGLYQKAEAEYRKAEMAFYAVVAAPSDKVDEAWVIALVARELAIKAKLAALAPDVLRKLTAAEKTFEAAEAALTAAAPDEWNALKKMEKAAAWPSQQGADLQEMEETIRAAIPNEFAAYNEAQEAFKTAETAYRAAQDALKTAAPDAFDVYETAVSERLGPEKVMRAHDALWKEASKEVAAWRESESARSEALQKQSNAAKGVRKAMETAAKEAKEVLKAAATKEMAAWIAAETKLKRAIISAYHAPNEVMKEAAGKKWAKVIATKTPDERHAALEAFIAAAPAEWKGWLEAERDMQLAVDAASEAQKKSLP